MININISNTIGASSSIKNESISTDTSSIWSDFINEFKLGLENNGDISNKTEGVDEDLILYNFIFTFLMPVSFSSFLPSLFWSNHIVPAIIFLVSSFKVFSSISSFAY